MKGLLLKDFYMLVKYCKSYIIIIAAFLIAASFGEDRMFFLYYPCMFCCMIPVTLLGFDERSGWDVYCGALPCTKAQIVSGKYIIGLIMQGSVFALACVIQLCSMGRAGSIAWGDYLSLMAPIFVMSSIITSISFPFIFKLGVEKGRMSYYIMFGVACAGVILLSRFYDGSPRLVLTKPWVLLIVLAGAALYALSWYLSIVLYKKRELT